LPAVSCEMQKDWPSSRRWPTGGRPLIWG